jgi:hypothetical protein
MKASYKLELEKQQRRLRLSHNQLNRLDRKHNDINLIKQLKLLELKEESAPPPPPAKTGFYGTITFTNYDPDSCPIDIVLQTIDGATYTTIYENTIYEDSPAVDFVITEQDRFLEPYTTLRFNYSETTGDWFEFADDVEGVSEINNSGYQQMSGYHDYFINSENLDNGNILFPMNVRD